MSEQEKGPKFRDLTEPKVSVPVPKKSDPTTFVPSAARKPAMPFDKTPA